jgi:hypothetical protein
VRYRAASPVDFLDCKRKPLANLPSETGRLRRPLPLLTHRAWLNNSCHLQMDVLFCCWFPTKRYKKSAFPCHQSFLCGDTRAYNSLAALELRSSATGFAIGGSKICKLKQCHFKTWSAGGPEFVQFPFLRNIALQFVFPVFGLHFYEKINPLFEVLNLTWARKSTPRFISCVSIDGSITVLHNKIVLFASKDSRSPRLAPAIFRSQLLSCRSQAWLCDSGRLTKDAWSELA